MYTYLIYLNNLEDLRLGLRCGCDLGCFVMLHSLYSHLFTDV